MMNFKAAWKGSRAGARAGAGFRFQDAATVLALTLCWCDEISANASTPESLDDFSLEASDKTIWVQVKSKIDPKTCFRAREIADIILTDIGANHDVRVIFLDRPFLDYDNRNWTHRISINPDLVTALTGVFSDDPAKLDKLRARLTTTTIITVSSPIPEAVALISDRLKIGEGAATICAQNLLHRVGESSSENSRRKFTNRSSVTVGEIETMFSNILELIDSEIVDQTFQLGISRFIDFHESLDDPKFFEGVSARPGHVAAGLVQPRDEDVNSIVEPLFLGRHVLVAGPSGAGKSALCYLAAFETRHALRWIEVSIMSDEQRPILLRGLRAQAPTVERPLVIYVDDIGRGNNSIWAWLVEQARHIPGLRVVGSVREEDVGILSSLDQVTIYRPKLSELLAQRIWERLAEADSTRTAHWKEAFELSNGLLLEFVHILTQGERLHDVVFEQVRRRVQEGRDDELAMLPIAAAAGMYGARVNKSMLIEESMINQTKFSSAFLRLRNEHLIGIENDGQIIGLHELRSREIFNACCELLALDSCKLANQAFQCISSLDIRRYATRSVRDDMMDDVVLAFAASTRLNKQPDTQLLIGILEALRLITFDKDADAFKNVADKFNLSHREYILPITFLNAGTADSLSDDVPVFAHLKMLINEFQTVRAPDRRSEFLGQVTSAAMKEAAEGLDTPKSAISILMALYGLEINHLAPSILERTKKVMLTANINEVAEYLAILEESDLNSVKQVVEYFGGANTLLERLWEETPWAIKPEIRKLDDGNVEIQSDILAVSEDIQEKPDSIIFEYASRLIQLFPEVTTVISRPLQLSGVDFEINGYTPGLKKLNRSSVHSKASIAWNRMLMYAVAHKNSASSRTEVLERHRYGLIQAAYQLTRAADRICRGQAIKSKHINEARALELIEDLMPPPPIGSPEEMLDKPFESEIDDITGRLIVEISNAIQKIAKNEYSGVQMSVDMESIGKAVDEAKTIDSWDFVGGAPQDALKEIGDVSSSLHRIGIVIGQNRMSNRSLLFSSRRKIGLGKGLLHVLQKVDRQWEANWLVRKKDIEESLGCSAFAAQAQEPHGLLWPDWKICLLVSSDTIVEFIMWVEEHLEALGSISGSCIALVVVPKINNLIVPQVAMRITKYGNYPDLEFEMQWYNQLGKLNWYISDTVTQMQIAQESILSLYATQFHLSGRELLKEESEQLLSWKNEAEEAFKKLQKVSEFDSNGTAEIAEQYLDEFHDSLAAEDGDRNEGAVTYARALQNTLLADEDDAQVLEYLRIVIHILESELGVMQDH